MLKTLPDLQEWLPGSSQDAVKKKYESLDKRLTLNCLTHLVCFVEPLLILYSQVGLANYAHFLLSFYARFSDYVLETSHYPHTMFVDRVQRSPQPHSQLHIKSLYT